VSALLCVVFSMSYKCVVTLHVRVVCVVRLLSSLSRKETHHTDNTHMQCNNTSVRHGKHNTLMHSRQSTSKEADTT